MVRFYFTERNYRKRDRLRKKYLLIKNDSSKELYKRQRNLVNNKKKSGERKVLCKCKWQLKWSKNCK